MKSLVVFDCEVYPNLFLICFKGLESNKVIDIAIRNDEILSQENIKTINSIFINKMCFGFNNRNYDIPIILYAMNFKTTQQIHELSKSIINNSFYGWQTLQEYGLKIPMSWRWFDIQEVAGARASLKLYGARIHTDQIIELPYDPMVCLNDIEIDNVINYCKNDLDITIDLFNYIKEQIDLREQMGLKYKENLLSKSDAQIAEKIIKSKFNYVKKIELNDIIFVIPKFIKFRDKELNDILLILKNIKFNLNDKGSIDLPSELLKPIVINNKKYQMGIGGLHSNEKSKNYISDNDFVIIDKDVASYYPSIILNCGLYPKHLGIRFLDVYRELVNERLLAKKNKDTILNNALKIVINGSFGKLGSKYSILYSPELMVQVTLTGQLSLLMLIENLENNGIEVISANTDGIVSKVPKNKMGLFELICLEWEFNTDFILEGTKYKNLYSRDVNNYLAIKYNGEVKGKGIFTKDNLSKNPQGAIVYEAVIKYLINNIPLIDTIKSCQDICKFLVVRTVKGGAKWKEEYIGKVVRWIYSIKGSTINYVLNNNKVAKSNGAYPIQKLISNIPEHIDYFQYEKEALEVLESIGLKL